MSELPVTYLEHSNDWTFPGYRAAPHRFPLRDLPEGRCPPVHFYHLYAGHLSNESWIRIAGEHFEALASAGFEGEVRVGIIGLPPQRNRVRAWLDRAWEGWELAAEADYGFEQVTHEAVHAYVQGIPMDTPVLYAHTKGGYRASGHSDLWRRCMQEACVTRWRQCVAKLEEGYDACGAHYLPVDGKAVGVPMFGGNYWWASAGYLAGLPAVRYRDRYDAEAWLGLGDMKAFDFVPAGWPRHPHPETPVTGEYWFPA